MLQKITPRYFINKTISNPQKNNQSYQLRRIIGEGSQGYVFEAVQISLGKILNTVAVKLEFKKNQNEIEVIQFLMSKQLRYIIKFLDHFEYQDYYIFVMELGNNDLYNYLTQSKNMAESQAINICRKISFCIKELHTYNLVHCDIKPESFLYVDHQFKLIDMGFVRKENQSAIENIGTPAFQALEMIYSKVVVSNKIDIWSLGCVFFEIFSKSQLFQGDNIKDQIEQYGINQTFVQQTIEQTQAPEIMKKLICSMISIKFEDRPNIDEVIAQLESLAINKNIVYTPAQADIDWS